uniref:Transcriptional repressor NF-X1-like n=1 Tax=Saccoglossus kowalevskii TaxID=10224 RepID=A0ABM0MET3_SACKO|nr:PREDICTED: transcriptional repressor NF-X1-like [Saccoglossus kowalevskii]
MTDSDQTGRNTHYGAYSEQVPFETNDQQMTTFPANPHQPSGHSLQYFEPPSYNSYPQHYYRQPVIQPMQYNVPGYHYPPNYNPSSGGYHTGGHAHQQAGFTTGNNMHQPYVQSNHHGQFNNRRGWNSRSNKSWRRPNDPTEQDSMSRASTSRETGNVFEPNYAEWREDLGEYRNSQHTYGARPKYNYRGRGRTVDSILQHEGGYTEEQQAETSETKVSSDSELTENERRNSDRMAKSCEEIDTMVSRKNKEKHDKELIRQGKFHYSSRQPPERHQYDRLTESNFGKNEDKRINGEKKWRNKAKGKESKLSNEDLRSGSDKHRRRRRSLSFERLRRSRSGSHERPGDEQNTPSQVEMVSSDVPQGVGGSASKDRQSAKANWTRRPQDTRFKDAKSADSDKNTHKKSGKGKYLNCLSSPRSNSSENLHREAGGIKSFHSATTSAESQTGSMIEALSDGTYECMVCCDAIKCQSAVWSCQGCYTVFHLHCIRKWARSPVARRQGNADGWRCPACQNVCAKIPSVYECFCGKVRDPNWVRTETAHSCGELCKKKRSNTPCPHQCNILCHPGPCPSCPITITKKCVCGKSEKPIRCGTVSAIHCDAICGKTLNCGLHSCEEVCHAASCKDCTVMNKQECYCGRSNREVVCGTKMEPPGDGPGFFSCQEKCARQLSCNNHTCEKLCHPGPCGSCSFLPSSVTHCPCGQTPLSSLLPGGKTRTSCTDPIPTCDNICNKKLTCGTADKPHACQYTCHDGVCGPCTGISTVNCRCGYTDKDIPCAEFAVTSQPPSCDKRCNKKRQCGRHRCHQRCCVDKDHKCPVVCGRKLSCGLHRCEEPCHTGNCEQCWQAGFDELPCHCGIEIIFPPIPCGTKPPECNQPCSRQHDCEHPIMHNCHSDERCPPCTQLVQRRCMGGHELRSNIACHIKDISCGRPCGKELPCKQHKCLKTCHKGECDGEICTQPCLVRRQECGHPCGAPCHPGKQCPKLSCKTQILITCKCGNRSEKTSCMQGGDDVQMAQAFQRLATSQLASKMKDIQSGQTVDISNLMQIKDGHKQRQLECTVDCAVMERNRRFAEALNIGDANLSSKAGVPDYSQFLKEQARKNPAFVASVERDLSNLVQALQQIKQNKKSHSFTSMTRDHRQVIHELAEHYKCETMSYDPEPKRSTVATAIRNRSYIPAVTLTSLIQNEMHPKAPTPIPHVCKEDDIRMSVQASKQSTDLFDKKKPAVIDYFDMVQ